MDVLKTKEIAQDEQIKKMTSPTKPPRDRIPVVSEMLSNSNTSPSESNSVISKYMFLKLELKRTRREQESMSRLISQLEEENSRLRASWERISGECSVGVIQQTLFDVYKKELHEARVRLTDERECYSRLLHSQEELESKIVHFKLERGAYEQTLKVLETKHSECQVESRQTGDSTDERTEVSDNASMCEMIKLRNEVLERELDALKEVLRDGSLSDDDKIEETHEARETTKVLNRRKDMIYEEIPSQNELQFLQQELTKLSSENLLLARTANENQQQLARLTKLTYGDEEISLCANDATPSFGIKFGSTRGPPRLNQSNIVIGAIDFDSLRELKTCRQTMDAILKIKVGDFVIRINDFNVQEASINQVRDLCNTSTDKIDLVLRKEVAPNVAQVRVEIPSQPSSVPLGLQLGVFTKVVDFGSKAHRADIMQMDEIKKVNNRKVEELTLAQIFKSMDNKKHCDVTLQRDAAISTSDFAFWGSAYQTQCRTQQRHRSSVSLISSSQDETHTPDVQLSATKTIPGTPQNVYTHYQTTPTKTNAPQFRNECTTPAVNAYSRKTQSMAEGMDAIPMLKTEFRDVFKNYSPSPEEYVKCSRREEPGFEIGSETTSTDYEIMDVRSKLKSDSYVGSNTGSSASLECRSVSPKSEELPTNANASVTDGRNMHPQSPLVDEYTSRWVDEQGVMPRSPLFRSDGSQYENDSKEILVRKKHFESFGFRLLGGNKAGIFVSTVENYSPASEAGVAPGMMLMQVNHLELRDVAYCFVIELMKGISQATQATFVFRNIPDEEFATVMSTKPYDKFHVKSQVDYTASAAGEISFSVGEILCVIDSHVTTIGNIDNDLNYRWRAFKTRNRRIEGLIPRQTSTRVGESTDRKPVKKKESFKGQDVRRDSRPSVEMYEVLDAVRTTMT